MSSSLFRHRTMIRSSLIFIPLFSLSCGSGNSDKGAAAGGGTPVGVNAGALILKDQTAALRSLGSMALTQRANLSPGAPNLSAGEYPGMGVNYGETQVDGFKIRLLGVGLGTGRMGDSGSRSLSLFNWQNDPQELEISAGLNKSVTGSTEVSVSADTYTHATVSIQRNFDIKAYAYLDTDNNGSIDTTIYTKANDVVKASRVIPRPELLSDTSLGYDYYRYNFLYEGPKTNDPNPSETLVTIFVNPITVCESPQNPLPTSTAGLKRGSDLLGTCTEVEKLTVDLLIDTVRVVKAWDGRYGNDQVSPQIPQPGMPFPYSDSTTNGATYGFKQGEPDFGLTYLPVFSFVSAGDSAASGVTSETYMLSHVAPTDAAFKLHESYRFSVVYGSDGKPIQGKTQANSPNVPLYVGMAARQFTSDTSAANTYSFYTGGGSVDPDGDVSKFDGGLDYNDDKTMAGHRFDGFKSLPTIGQTLEIKQYDEKRCDLRKIEKKMHEDMKNPLSCTPSDTACLSDPLGAYQAYNYCVAFRATKDTSYATDFATDSKGVTYRKIFLTRIR